MESWRDGTKWEYDITNNNYWNFWETLDNVYQSNNDYSREQKYKSTTNELNGCWRVQKCRCSEPRGRREPSIVIVPIFDHRDGQYVRPNKVTLKYFDFKKDVDLYAHVRMFNSIVKANVKTSEEYIINVFSYTLRNTTSDWCHNYMSKFSNYMFLEITHAFCKCDQKIQNDEQIYMELKNMKHEEIVKMEVYYEQIQKLAHGLQVPTIDIFLTIVFRTSLQ